MAIVPRPDDFLTREYRPTLADYDEDDMRALRLHVHHYVGSLEDEIGIGRLLDDKRSLFKTMTVNELLASLRNMYNLKQHERCEAEAAAAPVLRVHIVETR